MSLFLWWQSRIFSSNYFSLQWHIIYKLMFINVVNSCAAEYLYVFFCFQDSQMFWRFKILFETEIFFNIINMFDHYKLIHQLNGSLLIKLLILKSKIFMLCLITLKKDRFCVLFNYTKRNIVICITKNSRLTWIFWIRAPALCVNDWMCNHSRPTTPYNLRQRSFL